MGTVERGTHLQVVVKLSSSACMQSRCAISRGGDQVGWGLESLMAREALVHAGKVDIPGRVHRLGILPPKSVHLLDVVGVRAICEGVVRGRRLRGRERAGKGLHEGLHAVPVARPVQSLHDTGKTSEPVHR